MHLKRAAARQRDREEHCCTSASIRAYRRQTRPLPRGAATVMKRTGLDVRYSTLATHHHQQRTVFDPFWNQPRVLGFTISISRELDSSHVFQKRHPTEGMLRNVPHHFLSGCNESLFLFAFRILLVFSNFISPLIKGIMPSSTGTRRQQLEHAAQLFLLLTCPTFAQRRPCRPKPRGLLSRQREGRRLLRRCAVAASNPFRSRRERAP